MDLNEPRLEKKASAILSLRRNELLFRQRLFGDVMVCVKELVVASQRGGETYLYDNVEMSDQRLDKFCLVLETVLLHGLKDKSTLFSKTSYWNFIQELSRDCAEARNALSNVSQLPQVKTVIGKGRAWFRMALMERKLADYLRILVSDEEIMNYWYEKFALLKRKEEADMLLGMLSPLAVVDFSLCLKDIDFDNLPSDLRFYDSEFTVAAKAGVAPSDPQPRERRLRRTFSFSQAFSSLSYTSPTFSNSPTRTRKGSLLAHSSSSSPSSSPPNSEVPSATLSLASEPSTLAPTNTLDEVTIEKRRLFSDRPSLEQLRLAFHGLEEDNEDQDKEDPASLCLSIYGKMGCLSQYLQSKSDGNEGLSLTEEEKSQLGKDLSDVLFSLLKLADVGGINLPNAAEEKLKEDFPPIHARLLQIILIGEQNSKREAHNKETQVEVATQGKQSNDTEEKEKRKEQNDAKEKEKKKVEKENEKDTEETKGDKEILQEDTREESAGSRAEELPRQPSDNPSKKSKKKEKESGETSLKKKKKNKKEKDPEKKKKKKAEKSEGGGTWEAATTIMVNDVELTRNTAQQQEASAQQQQPPPPQRQHAGGVAAVTGRRLQRTQSFGGGQKCMVCKMTAYHRESVNIQGNLFHISCLKCTTCNKPLGSNTYHQLHGRFYCRPHYNKEFAMARFPAAPLRKSGQESPPPLRNPE